MLAQKTKDGMTQNVFTDHDLYMSERIQEMEQEIKELTRKWEEIQWENDAFIKRLFTLENMKSKETAAALYSGFSNWDTFMAVYKYLDPGDREQNISFTKVIQTGYWPDFKLESFNLIKILYIYLFKIWPIFGNRKHAKINCRLLSSFR